jgi:protease I
MHKPLTGQKIAILVANGFDEVDMTHAQRALAGLGATLKIISTENGLVNSWTGTSWGHHFPTDGNVSTVLAADYDGLFVPGGTRSLAKLKDNAHCRRITRGFFDAGKPMMFLGCAVELLAVAERATDCTVTGDASSEAAMTAAGATWSTEPEMIQGFLATGLGNNPENPLFGAFAEFYAQPAEVTQQAA